MQCGESSSVAFSEELAKRQVALRAAMDSRREEQSAPVARVADYLIAQLELEKYPEEVFNQIIEPGDLNPFVVRKWQAFLTKDKLSAEPLFSEWHQLSSELGKSVPSLSPNESAEDATFAERKSARLRQVAERDAAIFTEVEKHLGEVLTEDPTATGLAEPKEEAYRKSARWDKFSVSCT